MSDLPKISQPPRPAEPGQAKTLPPKDYQYQLFVLTIEVGLSTIRMVFRETGIPVSRLEAIVNELEAQYYEQRLGGGLERALHRSSVPMLPRLRELELVLSEASPEVAAYVSALKEHSNNEGAPNARQVSQCR